MRTWMIVLLVLCIPDVSITLRGGREIKGITAILRILTLILFCINY